MRRSRVDGVVLLVGILALAWPSAQLPPAFVQLGTQTHRAFDALADQLRGGASDEEVAKSIAALTGNCVACHATYRLDEAR